jgi:hypothetical protein
VAEEFNRAAVAGKQGAFDEPAVALQGGTFDEREKLEPLRGRGEETANDLKN